jgi:uncharacterized protein HemX
MERLLLPTPTEDYLSRRVQELERALGRGKAVAVGLAVLLAIFIVVAGGVGTVLQARLQEERAGAEMQRLLAEEQRARANEQAEQARRRLQQAQDALDKAKQGQRP